MYRYTQQSKLSCLADEGSTLPVSISVYQFLPVCLFQCMWRVQDGVVVLNTFCVLYAAA